MKKVDFYGADLGTAIVFLEDGTEVRHLNAVLLCFKQPVAGLLHPGLVLSTFPLCSLTPGELSENQLLSVPPESLSFSLEGHLFLSFLSFGTSLIPFL